MPWTFVRPIGPVISGQFNPARGPRFHRLLPAEIWSSDSLSRREVYRGHRAAKGHPINIYASLSHDAAASVAQDLVEPGGISIVVTGGHLNTEMTRRAARDQFELNRPKLLI